mmetsp:Transcript_9734/g.20504  ORF Transcript_9734/g.20504 Transcript_9734/m.20504 type:complete len:95 (+) Transcript_9734:164-448(+)
MKSKHEIWFARATGENEIKRFAFLQWRAHEYMLHKKMVACAARGTRSDYTGKEANSTTSGVVCENAAELKTGALHQRKNGYQNDKETREVCCTK